MDDSPTSANAMKQLQGGVESAKFGAFSGLNRTGKWFRNSNGVKRSKDTVTSKARMIAGAGKRINEDLKVGVGGY